MTYPYIIRLSLVFIFCLSANVFFAQGFGSSIVLGFTAAQIDGDNLAGFDKLGIAGGMNVSRKIGNRYHAKLEFLYSQRGSQSKLSLSAPGDMSRTHLNYIEIPLLFGINDWLSPDGDFFKVRAETGLSYGYLISANSTDPQFESQIINFRRSMLSYSIAAAYSINKRWSINARYTRDISTLLPDGFKSYFWTIRTEFKLL